MRELTLTALPGMPEVTPGAPLAELLLAAVERAGKRLEAGDVVVVAQKMQARFGQTFVIVTHNQEFAAMTDRILEIKDGRMVL